MDGEAIADYVAHQLAIVEGVHQGIADMKAGRLVPHDEAMTEIDAVIDGAERKRRG